MIKYNLEYNALIKKICDESPFAYAVRIKANKSLLEYINSQTPLLQDEKYKISTKVYWLLNNITDFPKCKICGKEITKNVKLTEGYPSHCSAKCLSKDPEVQKRKEESYQKKYGDGIINPFQAKEVIKQINDTNFKKYGVKRYTQSEDYRNVVKERHDEIEISKYNTHVQNKSFNTSKYEGIVFDLLKNKYPDVIHSYYSEQEYPFKCDFYIPSEKLFIEYNGTWTHGGHPFDRDNEDDLKCVENWKNKNNEYYNNAIYTWTDLDVRKRTCAKNNGLNYLELWSMKDVYDLVYEKNSITINRDELFIPFNRKTLSREFDFYKNFDCNILQTGFSRKNEIVKFFQQDTFYKNEKSIWKNDIEKRNKLIENRCKFLNKQANELNDTDILTGFKKSGIYYGYSHFNPLWFKWFINEFNVKSCYDPCGGWGHRLLGGLNLEKYIYNDYSPSTKANVDRIIRYFNIFNTETYCEDCGTFIPPNDFQAMFTCPPYYNIEHYECGDFKDISDFNNFLDSIFNVFYQTKTCSIFGLVIREDLIGNHNNYVHKFKLNDNGESYFNNKVNNNSEFLFVFKK